MEGKRLSRPRWLAIYPDGLLSVHKQQQQKRCSFVGPHSVSPLLCIQSINYLLDSSNDHTFPYFCEAPTQQSTGWFNAQLYSVMAHSFIQQYLLFSVAFHCLE